MEFLHEQKLLRCDAQDTPAREKTCIDGIDYGGNTQR